jgi:hypothetical protein
VLADAPPSVGCGTVNSVSFTPSAICIASLLCFCLNIRAVTNLLKATLLGDVAFTDKLLLTLIGGLLLWIIKDVTIYLLQRSRIRAALLTEVSFLIRSIVDTKQYLEGPFSKTIQAGKKVEYSAIFTAEEPRIYNEYAPVLTSYFRSRDLVRVIKFYRAVQEFAVLSTGFFSGLTAWKTQDYVLKVVDVQYLERKKARIVSIANIIASKDIHDISELPEDYKGALDASTIIR